MSLLNLILSLINLILLLSNISNENKNLEDELFILYKGINLERAELSLPELKIERSLELTAKDYVETLIEYEVLSHNLFLTGPLERVLKRDKSFYKVSEILAANVDIENVIEEWMKSSSHRKAILKKDISYMGGAIAISKSNIKFFVLIFGEK